MDPVFSLSQWQDADSSHGDDRTRKASGVPIRSIRFSLRISRNATDARV
jgi:hypothetical protein